MSVPFLIKYKPKRLKDLYLDSRISNVLNELIKLNNLSIILIGDQGSGKTTIINTVLNEYYLNIDIIDSSSLFQQYNYYLNIDIKPNNVLETNINTILQNQQIEINELKKENTLIKYKLNELLELASKQTI